MSNVISEYKSVNGIKVLMSAEEREAMQIESDANLIQSAIDSQNEELTLQVNEELKTILPDMLDFMSGIANSPQSIKDANQSVKSKRALITS